LLKQANYLLAVKTVIIHTVIIAGLFYLFMTTQAASK